MTENGDVRSPAPSGATSQEPKLLWSAYKSFNAVKCNASVVLSWSCLYVCMNQFK